MVVVSISLAACAEQRPLGEPCTDDCTARVHAAGILDPASDAFHGRELRRRNWDFALCASCHGDDFAGGRAGVSCLDCHRDGPTACVTCHRAGPTSNAHGAHRTGDVGCAECHVVPARWDTPGHLGSVDVTFGARAQATLAPADRAGPPTWDGASCRNVYCHGAVLHAGGGLATAPRWDAPVETGRCDRCHASPPPSHARTDCATCHPANAPHIDGAVQLGVGCTGCHGGATSPAPPTDLAGNQFTTAIGVGAHQAHLQGTSRLAAPIACATCHVVPSTVDATGHIDSPAPAEVVAAVGWDRATQTCTTGCHGAARPPWTSSGQVSCGSCHGVPPADASHTPAMPITACASCHPDTVDAFGNILITSQGSKHLDGVVDAP
jgi:predicted CxxxxCH...CXXCH cytochrome family protein